MFMSVEFKVGDRVRIKSWGQLNREFGPYAEFGYLRTDETFVKGMRYLCGETATIRKITGTTVDLRFRSCAPWADTDRGYSTDMLEHVEENVWIKKIKAYVKEIKPEDCKKNQTPSLVGKEAMVEIDGKKYKVKVIE